MVHLRRCSSGLVGHPAPRSSLSVTRLDLRGFKQLVSELTVRLTSSPMPWSPSTSPSRRSYCYARRAPALVGFAPLQSSSSNALVGGFRPPLLGFAPGALTAADITAVAVLVAPDLPAPPSITSPASTPAATLLPSLRSRGANLAIPFRPHRFARSRRFPPPIAPLSRDFAPFLAQDSQACCILLPILGFAAFRAVIRVGPAPHTGRLSTVDVQPVTRIPCPRSAFHTLWRIPLIRSRVVSPRPLPP